MVPDTAGPHADLLALFALLFNRALATASDRRVARKRIAARAGIVPGHLSDLLNGRKRPPPDTARRLAQAMTADEGEAQHAFELAERIRDSEHNVRKVRRARSPKLLRPPPEGFVGRLDDLAELSRQAGVDGRKLARHTVTLVTGQPGVGKTWLLRHWAHRQVRKWPDGQLYADLRDFATVDDVLRHFLVALGVPPASAAGTPQGRAAQLQNLTAGRRILVALDNVTEDDNIEPLMPGEGPTTVVVTSRAKLYDLVSLHNAAVLHLDVLSEEDGRALLLLLIGSGKADREEEAFRGLLRICSGLPVALSLVGAQVRVHPSWPLSQVLDRYLGETSPVTAMTSRNAELDLLAILTSGYQGFDARVRFAFRMLGLGHGVDLELEAAASLMGIPAEEARTLLTVLSDASFLDQPERDRYRMHDLMRSFAAGRAAEEDSAGDRSAAQRRLAEHLLFQAYAGERLLSPERPPIELTERDPGVATRPLSTAETALAWFEANDALVITAQQAAAEHGWHTVTWQLAWSLDNYQYRRGVVAQHEETWRRGLAAACRAGEPGPIALARLCLGNILARQGRHQEALALLEPARRYFRETGDTANLGQTHRALQFAWEGVDAGRQLRHAEEALRIFEDLGQTMWVAIGLNAVGESHAALGDYDNARDCCEQALRLHREHKNRSGEAATLDSLGVVAEGAGDPAKAARRFAAAVDLYDQLKNVSSEANSLTRLGRVLLGLPGRADEGRTRLEQALGMYEEQGRADDAERVRGVLDQSGFAATRSREIT